MRSDLDNLLDFVVDIAEHAGEITLGMFGRTAVEFKGDGSEVTAADHAAEEYLRNAIAEKYPEDGIVGEEGGDVPTRTDRRWILDPIDGTRSFGAGVPLFGVLVALEENGEMVLGCCRFPALGDTLVAGIGGGAWFNGARARVSACDDLTQARLVTSGLEYWRDWAPAEGREGWSRLVDATRFTRTWGDSYGYALVATGRAEIMADPACGALWDYAPMVPILRESGGRYTTLAGSAIGAWTTALASNGRLHDRASRNWPSDFRPSVPHRTA
jgi:histidinol-phosphatase